MIKCVKAAQDTTVLIIEDEARLREVLVSCTKECGFQATAARSAEEAITQMEQEPCDIVMLDLNLPCMDGLQCFEIVRERWPETSVVILTGFGNLEAAQQAIRLNVIDFLTKPASLGDIERALHQAWRKRYDTQEVQVDESVASETTQEHNTVQFDSPQTIQEIEHDCIIAVLEKHGGNRSAAAAELGISVRTLYYRLADYQRIGYRI